MIQIRDLLIGPKEPDIKNVGWVSFDKNTQKYELKFYINGRWLPIVSNIDTIEPEKIEEIKELIEWINNNGTDFNNSKVSSIIWNNYNDPSNMNDFVVAGMYNIKGEHTRINDNLPILNTGGGHTFNARLTVLDSSITGSGENDDKCITQILSFDNRLGQGEVYIRTGKGRTHNSLTWEPWSTLQRNVNVGQVDTLDNLIDNGIYSGVWTKGSYNSYPLTFVCVVINDYFIGITPRRVSQFVYGLSKFDGSVIYQSRIWDDSKDKWGDWEILNKNEITSMISEEIKKITDGIDPEKIDSIKDIVAWIDAHGGDVTAIYKAINENRNNININKDNIANNSIAIGNEEYRATKAEKTLQKNIDNTNNIVGTEEKGKLTVYIGAVMKDGSTYSTNNSAYTNAFEGGDIAVTNEGYFIYDVRKVSADGVAEMVIVKSRRLRTEKGYTYQLNISKDGNGAFSNDEHKGIVGLYNYEGGDTSELEQKIETNKTDIQYLLEEAVKLDGFEVEELGDGIGINYDGFNGNGGSIEIPFATEKNAGVMSAEDKTYVETSKYPLFDLEVEKVHKKFYDSGYLASFVDVKLGFNYDGSKYFVYFGNGITANNILNPNSFIRLYKDGSDFLSLRPIESSPNEARVFKSADGSNTIVLDITKLDPTYDFSLSVNSGVNLNKKCFGFTDRADIKSLEGDVENLNKSVSEIQGNAQIIFPYVVPSPLYSTGTEDSSIQKYGLLSRQFIKELYIYDKSNIQNEDITSVFVNLVARNNSTYGWLIWIQGVNKEGTSSQSFIQAKTGGKKFDESTEIIELVYNDANGGSPCGYIVVDWAFIESGVNLNSVFKWVLTEHCLDIVYSPIIKAYIDDKNIKSSTDETISEINENFNSINNALNLTTETLAQDSIITQYVHPDGSLYKGDGNYGSYVYNIEGIFGMFEITAGVSNNRYVSVCRVVDVNGNRITKFPLQTTNIGNSQIINIQEKDNAKTLYVSVTMSNNVTTKPSVVIVENSKLLNIENDIEDIQEDFENLSEKIVVFDKKRITDNDKVVDSSIVNPLKCYSDKANNFGTNNGYNYWYTLFKLPAHIRCVPFERKNTMAMNVALVVKVDNLDQFKLNGSYTRLVAGGYVDTSSYGTDEVYQHKPIEFDEDTYIAVLSNSETDYTKFCYLEFWTTTDTTLTDINNRVLELEGVGVEKPKPYEIVIPDKVYAVVGDTLQIFYDSVFNVQNLSNYQVQVLSDKGKAYPRYFEYAPTLSDIGETILTFNLCEVTDCTTGVTKILTSKEVNLITVPTLTNSISANILCVGDSTTAGGAWCKELARRFYANDGTPKGLGLTSINICGRKTGVVSNKNYGWEGTGGWTWGTYVSSPVDAVRFQVKDVTSLTMGANYVGSNGAIYEITEINVTNGVGNVRCMYSYDTPNKNDLPTTGTLTKRYTDVAGDNTITYTSYEKEKFSPFYINNSVDFTDYANRYCNGIIDVIVIHLGINSMFGLKTNLAPHLTSIMNTAKIFIDKFHEQFPNSKVLLITPPKCSVIGGMAANYNATQTATEEIYNRQMFQYHKKYFELANQSEYKNWVTVVNTCGEFDTPYGYPYNEQGVNTRVSNIKERVGTNGVHPNGDGYNMIADSVYRTLSGIL